MSYESVSEICPVSIVIPAYNVGDYIVEAVDSLLNQSVKPLEIVIVNDGSTDDTLKILQDTYQHVEIVKVYTQVNQGAGTARNKGIELSSGDYIFCCDPDDVISPGFFEEFNQRISENSSLDLFCFNSKQFFENGTTKFKVNHGRKGWRKQGSDALCEMMLRGDYTTAAWTYILKRKIIVENELHFNGRVHEDHLYTLHGYLLSRVTFVSDNVYYLQRSRLGSLTKSKKNEHYIHGRFDALSSVLPVLKKELPNTNYYTNVKYNYVKNSLLAIVNLCSESYILLPSPLLTRFKDYSAYAKCGIKDSLIFRWPRMLVLIRRFWN